MDSLYSDDSRFEPDVFIKNESAAASPRAASPRAASSTPIPSTETGDATPASTRASPPKKKGTAATVKKAPAKRPPKSTTLATAKKGPKKGPRRGAGADDAGEGDSDNGPYCLCQGPDDHRWMICCEGCDDWFHGECIDLSKEVGENLIEKFICPRCTTKQLRSVYKRSCSMGTCKKAARLGQAPPSYFCSPEHAQAWWERLVARLPKTAAGGGGRLTDQLSQDEFMALLSSGLATVDEEGHWALTASPFTTSDAKAIATDNSSDSILSDEERVYVEQAAHARRQLEAETLLCHQMLALVELAQERRRAAVAAGRLADDMCGYDPRLDTISARDAFAAYAASPEGAAALAPGGEGEADDAHGMCERKRCKTHAGWQKSLPLGVRQQIRETAAQSEVEEARERLVREAAAERWRRKQSERNWVEVLED
ncbi:Zinc finger, FYVE/PHD-type [Cordyceps fumosorosea ARSEF 2679]|uniref:Zinc finger, FYVE/PHD-type n=1 Tax=Cordyceps fumosorosea (strain ARSEF 2679) TaxID=1081104 RepID=A0A167TJ75_CORFA|nr:Zinc finger, FYVE/PHD-type [Cordyceps fumosorosea ARSEF 2679]OAA60652.1 Zinc finger, FYVE/PHD-type [Cordyceps fumosorosea ARSEF 2679]